MSASGVLCKVVDSVRENGAWTLVLECGASVHVAPRVLSREPKRVRCPTCKPTTCGATNRDGHACERKPGHRDPWHTAGLRRWLYDARALAAPAAESVKA